MAVSSLQQSYEGAVVPLPARISRRRLRAMRRLLQLANTFREHGIDARIGRIAGVDYNVGLDALRLDRAPTWREVVRRCEFQCAVPIERQHRLHRTLAVARRADDER